MPDHSTMNVARSLFTGNASLDVSGGVYYYFSSGKIENCTFHANDSPGTSQNPSATVTLQNSSDVTVQRCIIASDLSGYGYRLIACAPTRTCNVVWGNALGPIIGGTLNDDEVPEDPLFCDVDLGIYFIYDISPAAPENSPCGQLIGAFPVACENTATLRQSFSQVKALY